MKLSIPKGSTDVKLFVIARVIADGSRLTAKTFSDVSAWGYVRENDTAATAVTPVTTTLGTHADGGVVEVDATNLPGVYQICPPDAAFATGHDYVVMSLTIDGAEQIDVEIQLTGRPTDHRYLGDIQGR